VNKLTTVNGININLSTIFWNNVPFATSYRLIITPKVDELNSLPLYNSQRGWFELSMSGSEGYTLPINLPAGTYKYKFIAVGNTTVVNEGDNVSYEIGYLTSSHSEENQFIVMEAPSG